MNLWQALRYFIQEAWLSLVRSWKVSLLAILTIAVSLFIGGILLLTTTNISTVVKEWRARAKVLVYLQPRADDGAAQKLAREISALDWVRSVKVTDSDAARLRFQETFPSLAGLAEDWEEEPLPSSLEVEFDPAAISGPDLTRWANDLRTRPEIEMVDDDRDWLAQLTTLVAVVRGIGLTLGAVLLGAAVFTIASVIRLTAYLYQEEIGIMRIVGATEFFIRGPFWIEGLLQGLLGGLLAVGGLFGTFLVLQSQFSVSSWGQFLLSGFLAPAHQVFLVALGGTAGLTGAVLSLRRERLDQGPPLDDE